MKIEKKHPYTSKIKDDQSAHMDSMDLPEGKCCNNCVWLTRCTWLLQRKGNETKCDWLPSRFKEQSESGENHNGDSCR